MTAGLVTFRLGAREYATSLCDVHEVVRLEGLADLPGMTAPLAGVLDLRGEALPVLDLRADPAGRGDVLVVSGQGGRYGVAVDQVRAVVKDADLPGAGETGAGVLPAYVLQVRRGADGPVFLVELAGMVDCARALALV